MTSRAAAGVGLAGAAGLLVLAPLALALALIGTITAVLTDTSTNGPAGQVGVDPARIPPLARKMLPRITGLTAATCPELPPAWVVAQVAAESGWNPRAFSRDRNGGAAGLYQLNQANWVAASGQPWPTIPPPAGADIHDPARHLDLAVPFVCANLRTATAQLRASGKTAAPLDAMLVCHIAGCSRVTGSATGIPTAGEAGCDTRCAALVARYLATVHRHLAAYATTPGRIDLTGLPAPTPFTATGEGCIRPDLTSRGCLTPVARHALDQTLAAFGPPGPTGMLRAVSCWDPHAQNPRSDHPAGRACDLFPTTAGAFPTGPDLTTGWLLAAWLRAHADSLQVRYLIWQGRIWSPESGDQNGWGRPYTGGGIYDPADATGGHYDHVHLSVR